MKTVAMLMLCLLLGFVTCGCGGSLWVVKEAGDLDALKAAETAGVVDLEIPTTRAENESRPKDWETSWVKDGRQEFAQGMQDEGAVKVSLGKSGDIRVHLKVISIYNGDGFSAFGSNPAHIEMEARVTRPDGTLIAVLTGRESKGDYKGVKNFVHFCYLLGEDLSRWIDSQR